MESCNCCYAGSQCSEAGGQSNPDYWSTESTLVQLAGWVVSRTGVGADHGWDGPECDRQQQLQQPAGDDGSA